MKRTVSIVVWCGLSACLPGDGTGLDPTGNPLPPAIQLSTDIQPILTANCAFSQCHGGVSPVLGQHLGAGQSYVSVVGVPSVQLPGWFRVRAGQPDSSYLVHKIQGTHLQVGGVGARMPLNAAVLRQGQIDTIRAWIANGALNN
ncbi:MAG: hypothetical protein WD934_11730 [Gemmatimonadales bacterium]